MESKTLGIHLVAELGGCLPALLDNEQQLKDLLRSGLKRCGLHELRSIAHKFDPVGVTVVSIINESHVAIHTYPENQHASIDIFHCSTDSTSLFELLDYLKADLQAQTLEAVELRRGKGIEVIEGVVSTSPVP
jgi:S-adenosylmethionine decarboxylase proenzyme